MPRTNIPMLAKTFRFDPALITEMEKVLKYSADRYPSMTNYVSTAIQELNKRERRRLEQEGLVWDCLGPDVEDSNE